MDKKQPKKSSVLLDVIVFMILCGFIVTTCNSCNPIKPTHDGKPKFEMKKPTLPIAKKALELFQHQK